MFNYYFIYNICVNYDFFKVSKGTQRSEVTNRKYHSNFNPEGHHITELKLRQWCLGLDSVIENLEMWIDWIENTCTYILFFKYKEYKGKILLSSILLL